MQSVVLKLSQKASLERTARITEGHGHWRGHQARTWTYRKVLRVRLSPLPLTEWQADGRRHRLGKAASVTALRVQLPLIPLFDTGARQMLVRCERLLTASGVTTGEGSIPLASAFIYEVAMGSLRVGHMRLIEYNVTATGCWECTSHKPNKAGYPMAGKGNSATTVGHRVYDVLRYPLAPGTVLRHTCDNRKCINPEHLLPGTHVDNVNDRVQRNRSARGSRNGRAKTTEAAVSEIRGDKTSSDVELATRYRLDVRSIRDIKQYNIWKHVKV